MTPVGDYKTGADLTPVNGQDLSEIRKRAQNDFGINTGCEGCRVWGLDNALENLPSVEYVLDGTKIYKNPNGHVIQPEAMLDVIFDV
jgi:hypothetical protein